ncbi:hypothetical protein DPMN_093442 [Dreissena polymorpha]|uniref:Uncharacterized protein n=1 Tax=Dreissena polymorpha TaxID=45954 RepID=A0A9D4R0W6_DREPO|nr:hypothetical protein DPMN_093442 [Dreissena polymorpha]
MDRYFVGCVKLAVPCPMYIPNLNPNQWTLDRGQMDIGQGTVDFQLHTLYFVSIIALFRSSGGCNCCRGLFQSSCSHLPLIFDSIRFLCDNSFLGLPCWKILSKRIMTTNDHGVTIPKHLRQFS